jgi:protein TonB
MSGQGREVLALAASKAELTRHSDVAYLHNPKPAYPAMARKLGLEGTVTLRILVNTEGVPEQSKVIVTSGAEVLDAAAVEAVQGWRFVPARQGRSAIAHWVDVPITFKLAQR